MRFFPVRGSLLAGLLGVVGCGAGGSITGSSYNPGYGPFDRRGNYVEAWADKPAKKQPWARKPAPVVASKPAKKETPTIAASTPRAAPPTLPRPTTPRVTPPTPPKPTYSPPKPKPTPTVVKPKAPPSRSHTVQAGDTLYSLSRKYGTTVSAIQRANGLSGTTIVTGKSLVIPR